MGGPRAKGTRAKGEGFAYHECARCRRTIVKGGETALSRGATLYFHKRCRGIWLRARAKLSRQETL